MRVVETYAVELDAKGNAVARSVILELREWRCVCGWYAHLATPPVRCPQCAAPREDAT